MQKFTVIAHRGASAYLPEHTLEAAALAHGMRADYIELDVVLTRDDVLIVLHDLYLDAITDVASRFHGRQRPDSHYYAIDFTLEEIRTLRVHERMTPDGRPALPDRFRSEQPIFRVATLQEMIHLIQGLKRSTGREAGIYLEPKSPGFHHKEGRDVVAAVLGELKDNGLSHRDDKVYLQSFDMAALQRARRELQTDLKLVQLIGENDWGESASDFNYLQTAEGLAEIAEFADGIGPWLPQIISPGADGTIRISSLVEAAHMQGLFVHAYTLRADHLPPPCTDLKTALDILIGQAGLDGVFTDHPDRVINVVAPS